MYYLDLHNLGYQDNQEFHSHHLSSRFDNHIHALHRCTLRDPNNQIQYLDILGYHNRCHAIHDDIYRHC